MVHYGHSNQLRQAKAMGDYLIAGVHTDGKDISQSNSDSQSYLASIMGIYRSTVWMNRVSQTNESVNNSIVHDFSKSKQKADDQK